MAPDEQSNIGSWTVWVEEADGGTRLVVEGELQASAPGTDVQLVKAEPQGSDERDLLLTIAPRVQLDGGGSTLKLAYREPLGNEHQYASVTITDQGTHLARIVDIGRREPA